MLRLLGPCIILGLQRGEHNLTIRCISSLENPMIPSNSIYSANL
jgi:hypothetical protein